MLAGQSTIEIIAVKESEDYFYGNRRSGELHTLHCPYQQKMSVPTRCPLPPSRTGWPEATTAARSACPITTPADPALIARARRARASRRPTRLARIALDNGGQHHGIERPRPTPRQTGGSDPMCPSAPLTAQPGKWSAVLPDKYIAVLTEMVSRQNIEGWVRDLSAYHTLR